MTLKLSVTERQLAMLREILQKHIPNANVWAYGSRTTDTNRPYSDLDIVVFTLPEDQPAVANLRETLEECSLPFMVDLHIWRELPENIRQKIQSHYVVLQSGSQDHTPAA